MRNVILYIMRLSYYLEINIPLIKIPSIGFKQAKKEQLFQNFLLPVMMLVIYLLIHVLKAVSYTHLRAHETRHDLVCRLLLEKKKKTKTKIKKTHKYKK